jgi:transposase
MGELVFASLRGKTIAELSHGTRPRRRSLDAGGTSSRRAPGGRCAKVERTELDELRGQVRRLERALGRKTLEVRVAVRLFGDE